MPSITYTFVPGQIVYVIDNGTVKSGTVSTIEIDIANTETIITYWILLDGELAATPFDEINVFASCRAAPGFQDVVFLNSLEGSPSPVAVSGSPLPGIPIGSPPVLTLTADILIDGTISKTLTHTVIGGEKFADLIAEINTQLGGDAVASVYNNNIRITSATTGSSSSVLIGSGSPLAENYFKFLNNFTGLAAPTAGLNVGAVEALGSQLCTR